MQRFSILSGTLALFLSMSTSAHAQENAMPRPEVEDIDCISVPFEDFERGENMTQEAYEQALEVQDICIDELDRWLAGDLDEAAKNNIFTEEDRDSFQTCFYCNSGSPVIRITSEVLITLPPGATFTLISTVLTNSENEESHEGVQLSDGTLFFQFDLDLDLDFEESEVVDYEIVVSVGGQEMQRDGGRTLVLREPEPLPPPDAGYTCTQTTPATPSKVPWVFLPGLLLVGLKRRRPRHHTSKLKRGTMFSRWFAALLLLITLAIPSLAFGQEEETKMNTEQINLLNEANAALGEGDLEKANAAIEQALEKGERFDVLLLTQGRVLQKQDKCQQAKKVFGEINVAPHAPSFTKADINRLKERYISQMGEMCSAKLKIDCLTEDTEVKLLGEVRECGSTIKLKEGGYQLIATRGKTTKAYDVALEGGEEKTFTVALEDIPDNTSDGGGETKVVTVIGVEDPERPPYRRTIVSGVTFGVLAAASGVTALIFRDMNQETSEDLDENYYRLDSQDNPIGWQGPEKVDEGMELEEERDQQFAVALGTGIGAGVLAVAGIATTTALFIGDRKRAKRIEKMEELAKPAPEASLIVAPGRDSAMGVLTIRF